MSRFSIVLALLLAGAPAAAQTLDNLDSQTVPIFKMSITVRAPSSPSLMVPLYSSFASLAASDGYLTWLAVRHGAVEENPVAAPVAGSAAGLAAFKVATGAATIFAVERLRRDHPRAAMWMMVAVNGGMTWVVAHNTHVAGVQR